MKVISKILLIAVTFAQPSFAQIGHTSYSSFENAVLQSGGTLIIEQFENETAGTIFPDGTSILGFEIHYDFGDGVNLRVDNEFTSVGASNYLGTTDAGMLQDGDNFDVVIEPSNSFGICFLTKDTLLDGDINLTFNGVSVDLIATDIDVNLPDGSFAYFLGVTNDSSTDTTAMITTVGEGVFLYNVDYLARAINGVLLGDVNCDGTVNLLDVAPFVELISIGEFNLKADVNMDGIVNLLDVAPFVAILTGG